MIAINNTFLSKYLSNEKLNADQVCEIVALVNGYSSNTELSDMETIVSQLYANDKITNETKEILEERIQENNMKERERILSLYPPIVQGHGKDKRWHVRPHIDGKGDVRIIVKATLEEVEDELIKRHKASLLKGITLEEALEKYLEDRQDITGSTKQHNRGDMKRFAKQLLSKPISNITALEIQKHYIDAIKTSNADVRACNNYKGILRKVFHHANKHYNCQTINIDECINNLNEDVNRGIMRKKETAKLFEAPVDRYSKDEVKAMLELSQKTDTLIGYAAITSLFTGQRISEISGMYKSDLNIDSQIINLEHAAHIDKETNEHYIGDPKGHKKRVIVIPDIAIPFFMRIKDLSNPDSPYLFSDDSDKRVTDWLSTTKIDKEIARFNKELGMLRKSAHDQRRTYDSVLELSVPSSIRYLLCGHELTGIDACYIRSSITLDKVKQYINEAFNNFLA